MFMAALFIKSKMSSNKGMAKETLVHLNNGILICDRKMGNSEFPGGLVA